MSLGPIPMKSNLIQDKQQHTSRGAGCRTDCLRVGLKSSQVKSSQCGSVGGRGPCTGTKYSVLQCSTTAPAPPKAKSGACFSFETTTGASHNYGKVGVSVSWILLALISFNRPILGRYLDGRLRRTAPMSTLTSPSNTHMLIRHRPDMCCMPAQPCAVPQMLSCIIRRVQYSCTTFSTALYSTR